MHKVEAIRKRTTQLRLTTYHGARRLGPVSQKADAEYENFNKLR